MPDNIGPEGTIARPLLVYSFILLEPKRAGFGPPRRSLSRPHRFCRSARSTVAALVDRVRADEVSLTLVNTDLVEGRSVLLQAGSFGEHQFTEARLASQAGPDQSVAVEAPHLRVHLGPAAHARLHLGLKRFARSPSYRFPAF